ncbi:hypothetical protein Syun_011782 [Stephania yunnanensis]|uniref:Uncharacterized protein n=1 Tax=Stephania yunnanensis TaxID=152371 RepID=A0AAP0K0M1_9MAGN
MLQPTRTVASSAVMGKRQRTVVQPTYLLAEEELTNGSDDFDEALIFFSGVRSRRKEKKRKERGEVEDPCLESQNLGVETPLKAMICKNDSIRLFESSIGRGDLCDCMVSKPVRNPILIPFLSLHILMKTISIVGLYFPTKRPMV